MGAVKNTSDICIHFNSFQDDANDSIPETRNGQQSKLNLHRKIAKKESPPLLYRCWRCFFGTRNVRHNKHNGNAHGLNSVSRIDKLSRIIFPSVFVFLNIIYWTIYLADEVELH